MIEILNSIFIKFFKILKIHEIFCENPRFFKILKIHEIFCENPRIIFVLFYDVHKVNMFTINLEDGCEAPSKASIYIYYLSNLSILYPSYLFIYLSVYFCLSISIHLLIQSSIYLSRSWCPSSISPGTSSRTTWGLTLGSGR